MQIINTRSIKNLNVISSQLARPSDGITLLVIIGKPTESIKITTKSNDKIIDSFLLIIECILIFSFIIERFVSYISRCVKRYNDKHPFYNGMFINN